MGGEATLAAVGLCVYRTTNHLLHQRQPSSQGLQASRAGSTPQHPTASPTQHAANGRLDSESGPMAPQRESSKPVRCRWYRCHLAASPALPVPTQPRQQQHQYSGSMYPHIKLVSSKGSLMDLRASVVPLWTAGWHKHTASSSSTGGVQPAGTLPGGTGAGAHLPMHLLKTGWMPVCWLPTC